MNGYNLYGWFTGEAEGQRTTAIVPTNQSLTEVEGEHRANWTGYEWVDLPYIAPVEIVPVEPVPKTCTMRQGRLALNRAGKLSMIDAAIASLPSPQREEAEIEWEYALELERAWPTLQLLGTAIGLTDEEMDDLFRLAVTL